MTRDNALNILWCIAAVAAVALVVFTPGCLFASQPVLREPLLDVCACIERNNYYDGEGRLVFTQYIWWGDELPYPNRVREWRLDKGQPSIVWRENRVWHMLFEDAGVLREIIAPSYLETWTQTDVEMDDRAFVSPENRVGFRRVKEVLATPPFVLEHAPEIQEGP